MYALNAAVFMVLQTPTYLRNLASGLHPCTQSPIFIIILVGP